MQKHQRLCIPTNTVLVLVKQNYKLRFGNTPQNKYIYFSLPIPPKIPKNIPIITYGVKIFAINFPAEPSMRKLNSNLAGFFSISTV